MKLNDADYKRFLELAKLIKSGKATDSEKEEHANLAAKKKKGSNDLDWWNQYPFLTEQVKNIAFNHIAGTGLEIGSPRNNNLVDFRIPGVAVVKFLNAIGQSVDTSDGFNAQMRQLWLDMHRKYRGIGAYQRSDVGMSMIAIIDYFCSVAKFERIYGVVNTYKLLNRNVPYTLMEALHIDAGVCDDLANFRYQLNQLIEKSKQLCLPRGLAAFTEKVILLSNIFADSENKRCSLFLWDTSEYGVFDPTLLSNGGCVKFIRYRGGATLEMTGTTPGGNPGFTVSDMMAILKTQLNALLDDDDITKICSDIIACYGPESVNTIGSLPEDYKLEAVYDYERQLQFHNLTIMGNVSSLMPTAVMAKVDRTTAYNNGIRNIIWQENNVIKDVRITADYDASSIIDDIGSFTGMVAGGASQWEAPTKQALFDVWKDNPDTVDVVCGSRFTSLAGPVKVNTNTKYFQELVAYGTEIVEAVEVFTKLGSANYFTSTVIPGTVCVASGVGNWRSILVLEHFDWHPFIIAYDNTGENSGNIYGDVDNPTKIVEADLKALHDNCVYSLFRISSVSYIKE